MVCGNVGDDNSTVCEKCGNPYTDIVENAAGTDEQAEKGAGQPSEQGSREMEQKQENVQDPGHRQEQAASVNRGPRRMRSGPQIYGQEGTVQNGQNAYGQQGMVRRTVQGRPAGQPQGRPSRPVNQGQGNYQGHPAGQPQGSQDIRSGQPAAMQGRPAGPMQGNGAGRPMGQMQGGPAGRPMGMKPSYHNRKVMETARASLKSPLFALIALLNTVFFASSIAAIFMNQLNYAQMARLLKSVELPSQVSGYANTLLSLLASLDSGHLIINFILNIPNLLFCIGLWMIFITAFTAKENMSGIGFGFAKACVIINLIKSSVVMLVCLVLAVAIVIASWVAGTQSMIVVSVIALVVIIIVVMMIIMYYFSYIATFKTCRINADEGESYGKVSGYVAVIHIILALFSVVNLLSGIVNSEITGIVGSIGKMGWMILFGVWIMMYRGKMSELED